MLKKLRQIKNLSQSQLAADSEVNLKMIQKYEQGVKNINAAKLETLLKLCITLECDLLDLINDPDLELLVKTYEDRIRGDQDGQVLCSQNM